MRTKLFKNAFWVIALAIVVCGLPMQASAVTFTFTEEAGFVTSSLTSTDTVTPGNDIKWYQNTTNVDYQVAPISGEFNTIAWGVSNNAAGLLGADPWGNTNNPYTNYSALRVFGQTGSVDADGAWVTLTKLYHQNNSISSSFHDLKSTLINGQINIVPSDSGMPNDSIEFVTFLETPNVANACPADGTPCRDYFTVGSSSFVPVYFTYGARQYEVLFDLLPIAYSELDLTVPGTIKVWTEEGQISELDVLMAIKQVPVPEPASLLLLGLGLLGLGFIKRRKG